MEMTFARARWLALVWFPRIGWLGIGGVLLAFFALLMAVDAHQMQRQITAQTATLLSAPSRVDRQRLEEALSPETQVAHFQTFLPDPSQIPQVIHALEDEARHNGIQLDQGQFKLDTQAGDRVARYEMVFPVKAEYGAMRAFLREALRSTPALGLEQLSFRRDDPNNVVLESRVQLALYVLLPEPSSHP